MEGEEGREVYVSKPYSLPALFQLGGDGGGGREGGVCEQAILTASIASIGRGWRGKEGREVYVSKPYSLPTLLQLGGDGGGRKGGRCM